MHKNHKMSKGSTEYGKWLGEYNWSHIVTIRLHYKLTEMQADNLSKRLINNSEKVERLFYSVEKDRQDNMNHMHLLLETRNAELSRKEIALASGLAKNPKAISFVQNADSQKAVSMYASKYIGREGVFYGYEEKIAN